MKVYVVFNGTRFEFDCDVNLDGYLERCCERSVETKLENGVFYEDELPQEN